MINIMSFSWMQLNQCILDQENVPVTFLIDNIASRNNKSFVLSDRTCRRSVLVRAPTVNWALEQTLVHPTDPITESGFLDLLGRDQITVMEDRPASAVVHLLNGAGLNTAIVINRDHEAKGIFLLNSVARRLPGSSMLSGQASHVRVLVQSAFAAGEIASAFALIESNLTDFHSERLNYMNPEETYCQGGGGHSVAQCPCNEHPNANCARLEID